MKSVATLIASNSLGEDFHPGGGMRDGSGALVTGAWADAWIPIINDAMLIDTASTRVLTCDLIICVLGKRSPNEGGRKWV